MRQVQDIIPRFVYVRHSNEWIQEVFARYVQQIVIDFEENVCSSISSVIHSLLSRIFIYYFKKNYFDRKQNCSFPYFEIV